jgi:hypothetical protein
MSIRRLTLSWSAVLLFAVSTAALAEPAAVCEDSSQAAASGGGDESSLLCHASLCESDWDCQNACPTARTATCVGYVCEYTYSGGGGGGGGGPLCPARLCSEDWDCECNGRYGYCGPDSTCYW